MPDLAPADWIGSTGVALLLLAFALNLTGHLRHESLTYPTMNAVGAGLAAYASWLIDYMPFVVLEGTWMTVSAATIMLRGRKLMLHSATSRPAHRKRRTTTLS